MKRLICISTGSFYQGIEKGRDYNDDIKIASKIKGIDGVEIMLASAENLMKFKINRSNKKFLRSLKFNTIHLPFFSKGNEYMIIDNNIATRKVIDKAKDIYDAVEAHNMNLHPNQIKDYTIFDQKGYNFSIENNNSSFKKPSSYYSKILTKNPNMHFVLDTTHAVDCNQLKNLVRAFSKKIIYSHLSGYCCNRQHLALHILRDKFLKNLEPVRNKKFPLIFEGWMETKDPRFYEEEIRFIRKWIRS